MPTAQSQSWWTIVSTLLLVIAHGAADGAETTGSSRGLITCGGEAAQSASYRAPVNIIGQQMIATQAASISFLNTIVLGPAEATIVQTPEKSAVGTGWLFYE